MSLSDDERSALDAQYNLRAAVPEHLSYFARYEATSRALRARRRGRLDLAYGATPRQAIDLFLPETTSAPLLVFIHGGYWQSRDRKDFSFVAEPWLERGVAVALIGYELAPAVRMDVIVEQVRTGLAWLHRHASSHDCDPSRLFLAGHSAGGHLAAMALATDRRRRGLPEDTIKGVCAISGVFDLEPIRLCYLNEVVGLDEDEARRNSPNSPPAVRPLSGHHRRGRAGDPRLSRAEPALRRQARARGAAVRVAGAAGPRSLRYRDEHDRRRVADRAGDRAPDGRHGTGCQWLRLDLREGWVIYPGLMQHRVAARQRGTRPWPTPSKS
jgi:arylformamidase